VAHIVQSDKYADMRLVRIEHAEMISDSYDIPKEWKVVVKEEKEVKPGDVLAKLEDATIAAQHGGRVRIEKKRTVIVSYEHKEEMEYEIPSTAPVGQGRRARCPVNR
jgi:DNA-directed RNA polymerase subunit beta'